MVSIIYEFSTCCTQCICVTIESYSRLVSGSQYGPVYYCILPLLRKFCVYFQTCGLLHACISAHHWESPCWDLCPGRRQWEWPQCPCFVASAAQPAIAAWSIAHYTHQLSISSHSMMATDFPIMFAVAFLIACAFTSAGPLPPLLPLASWPSVLLQRCHPRPPGFTRLISDDGDQMAFIVGLLIY